MTEEEEEGAVRLLFVFPVVVELLLLVLRVVKDTEGTVCFRAKGNSMSNRSGSNGWPYKPNLSTKRTHILSFFLQFSIYNVFCYKP